MPMRKLTLGWSHTWTHLARVSLAVFKATSIIVAWHVPTTPHGIVNVLTQARTLRAFFTSPETEFGSGHEVLAGHKSTTDKVEGHLMRTVHSCNCCNVPLLNALEKTKPPTGLPRSKVERGGEWLYVRT